MTDRLYNSIEINKIEPDFLHQALSHLLFTPRISAAISLIFSGTQFRDTSVS